MSATFPFFLTVSTLAITALYAAYRAIFRDDSHFALQRYVLIFIVLFSVLLPFNPLSMDVKMPDWGAQTETLEINHSTTNNMTHVAPVMDAPATTVAEQKVIYPTSYPSVDWRQVASYLYFAVFLMLLFRLIFNILKVMTLYRFSPKERTGDVVVVKTKKQKGTFSFFHWIFIYENDFNDCEKQQIIAHEKIHASQYHSFDILLLELLSAVMWFNPVAWMLKKRVRLMHEYLADEGVLDSGTNKIRYQMLLLNQITGEKFVSFSSHFNNSTIKKRMIMMDSKKTNKNRWHKSLWLLPVMLLFGVGTAFVNGQNNPKNAEKPLVVVIDIAHGGTDKGVVAPNGVNERDILLKTSQIIKQKLKDNPNIKIILTRNDDQSMTEKERFGISKAEKADLFFSIHLNWITFKTQEDVNNRKNNTESNLTLKTLSEQMNKYQNELNAISKAFDRKMLVMQPFRYEKNEKMKSFYSLMAQNPCPSFSLGIGHLTNKEDLTFINDDKSITSVGEMIANALIEYQKGENVQSPINQLFDRKAKDKMARINIHITPKSNDDAGKTIAEYDDKLTLWVGCSTGVNEEKDVLFDNSVFETYPADSEKITEILQQKLAGEGAPKKVWAKFYTSKKNPNAPIALFIGFTGNDKSKNLDFTKMMSEVIPDFFNVKEKGISCRIGATAEFTAPKKRAKNQ